MARTLRQSKILEIITTSDVETQEDLVDLLKKAKFDVTQATISRDIKELGLIKILADNKRYKYAYIESSEQAASNKYINIFKEAVISISPINNLLLIKTLNGLASAVNSFLDKLSISNILGSTYGDDTVTIYFEDNNKCSLAHKNLKALLYE